MVGKLLSVGVVGQAVARRAALGLALVALTALGASGCTKPEPVVAASVWDMPAVVWDGGAAPSGGAEDSPWAKEFRAAQLMTAYVWATVDTSYSEYVKEFGYEEAVQLGESFDHGVGNLKRYDLATGEYLPDAPVRWDAQRVLVTKVTEEPGGDSAVIEYSFVLYVAGSSSSEKVQNAVVRLSHLDHGVLGMEPVDDTDPSEPPTVDEIPTARWATPITAPTLPGEVKKPLC